MKTRKVGIIGVGHVGAHVAYSLIMEGIADELILLDKNAQKAESECQDLRDSVTYMPERANINVGTFDDIADCDVVVNCVGRVELLALKNDRLDELKYNTAAVASYIDDFRACGFNGIVVNISNPCDVITKQLADGLNLPKGHVFGTGTGLDSSRLISALSLQTGIDHKSIVAYMMGEHGADQFAPWSVVSFNGQTLDAWAKKDSRFVFDRDELVKKAIGGGWVTFAGKHCTEYGIASTAARVVRAILHDEKVIMPASAPLDGEYGEKGLFIGVPSVIGKNGIEEIIELPLTIEEKERFHYCCDRVRENAKAV